MWNSKFAVQKGLEFKTCLEKKKLGWSRNATRIIGWNEVRAVYTSSELWLVYSYEHAPPETSVRNLKLTEVTKPHLLFILMTTKQSTTDQNTQSPSAHAVQTRLLFLSYYERINLLVNFNMNQQTRKNNEHGQILFVCDNRRQQDQLCLWWANGNWDSFKKTWLLFPCDGPQSHA